MPSVIFEEYGEAVARVTIQRDNVSSAFTHSTCERLADIFNDIGERNDLRAVVLCVEGEEISPRPDVEGVAADESELREAERVLRVCDLIEACRVPVIAAVQDVATGGRCQVVLASHIRIASEDARFNLSQSNPAISASVVERLTRLNPKRPALEVILAGVEVDAEEALRVGLVNRVVNRGQLLIESQTLAREIAGLAPLAIRACLEAVISGSEKSLEEGFELEAKLFCNLFATEDVREGTRAFLQEAIAGLQGAVAQIVVCVPFGSVGPQANGLRYFRGVLYTAKAFIPRSDGAFRKDCCNLRFIKDD